MALTYNELESVTNDYFKVDGGKAVDIYFKSSFLMDRWMNKKMGLFERPTGGLKIRVPLEYDMQEGGFFLRGEPLSSNDKETVNAAFFKWKAAYGNATILWQDELENAGEYAQVQMITQKLAGAQKTIRKKLAETIYASGGDDSKILTGLLSLNSSSGTTAYGGIQSDDLVASDGTKPWAGNISSSATNIDLATLRTLRSGAKINDGNDGKPNIGVTTEALFNIVSGILQVQQRFIKDDFTSKAGFTNLVFEEMVLAADDYCPSGHMFLLNENHVGVAIHSQGFFVREKWMKIPDIAGKTMKIFFYGNIICNHRKAHNCHSSLS
jgi:hypothetical protein